MDNYFTKGHTQIVKGCAVFFMLIHHLFYFPERLQEGVTYISVMNLWGRTLEYELGRFGEICVDMFILLSGYGMYQLYLKRDKTLHFLSCRIFRVLRIYWFLLAVNLLLGIVIRYPRQWNLKEFIDNIFVVSCSYNGECWFLTPWLVLMVAFPLFVWVLERKLWDNVWCSLILLFTLSAVTRTVWPRIVKLPILADFEQTHYCMMFSSALNLLPSFLCGYLAAKFRWLDKVMKRVSNVWLQKVAGLVLLLGVFYYRRMQDEMWDYILVFFVIAACTMLVNGIKPLEKALGALGGLTTFVWMSHSWWCYYYFQRVIYAPKYSILIVLLQTVVSCLTAFVLMKLYGLLSRGKSVKILVTCFRDKKE